ncbi:MAG: ImmA/IrrE family metallo-endopeptidase [Bdellovibrionales bacterium]|nr:ImmA/IrrE family metallo-endopeptidase [Bdellovibrionales bacterium]
MKARYKHIERVTNDLLSKHRLTSKLPIDIENLIETCGIKLVKQDFQNTISGAAVIEGSLKVISVNRSEAQVRQRFTAAHELGHILLHQGKEVEVSYPSATFYRDPKSSTGEHWKEIEANYFASCVLMPKVLLEREIAGLAENNSSLNEEVIDQLSKKFKVSSQAMCIRLGALGFT